MNCEKNPGHTEFIPVQDFIDNHLSMLPKTEHCEKMKSWIDLTVRLRVSWTSPGRLDDDQLSEFRGTDKLRLGTGFVYYTSRNPFNEPCPCDDCDGSGAKKFWRLTVQTANHIVFNTDEAKRTKVDLFYDRESSQRDGSMKNLTPVEAVLADPNCDVSSVVCVTHDEALVNKIRSAVSSVYRRADPLNRSALDSLGVPTGDPAVIISHPHGQPKMVTVGKLKYRYFKDPIIKYHTATCPGSSGAPVFIFDSKFNGSQHFRSSQPVHSGSYSTKCVEQGDQLNFGHSW